MMAYKAITEHIKNNNGLVTALNVLDKAIVYITILLYAGYLIYGAFFDPAGDYVLLYRSILIPGVSFGIVSLFRKIISAPRPYEVYDFVPALKKDTVGKSFPSRHVFSIFMVAFTIMQSSVIIGVLVMILGACLAVIRVIGGVHFIKDVIAGFAMALVIAVICYGILCGVFGLIMLPF